MGFLEAMHQLQRGTGIIFEPGPSADELCRHVKAYTRRPTLDRRAPAEIAAEFFRDRAMVGAQ